MLRGSIDPMSALATVEQADGEKRLDKPHGISPRRQDDLLGERDLEELPPRNGCEARIRGG